MDTTNLCVYGTIRRGHYNCWDEVKQMTLLSQPTDTLSGYYMRTHGGFPAIFEGAPSDKVVVEVLDMTTNPDWPAVFESINRMEFGCGYFRRLVTTDGGHLAWVYVMPKEYEEHFPQLVESGDWDAYVKDHSGRNIR